MSLQIARLTECERVLVALELSNYLNDSTYALQAVTQCYGLLAPIIYHNIVLVPVVQVRVFFFFLLPREGYFYKGNSALHFEKEKAIYLLESENWSRTSMKFHELTEKHFNNLKKHLGKHK